MSEEKAKGYLSYNLVLGIGIGLLVIGFIFGGIVGDFLRMAGELLNIISFIMILIQTFKKDVTSKTKLAGWGLVVLWFIVAGIISSASKS